MAKQYDIYRDSLWRYMGYANEIGEAVRPLVPRIVVTASYIAATAYIATDTGDKALKVHNRNGTPKQVGITAGDVFLWQMLASVVIPGFTLNRITYFTGRLLRGAQLHRQIVDMVPPFIAVATIPIIAPPIDRFVDYLMDQTYRPFFKK